MILSDTILFRLFPFIILLFLFNADIIIYAT